MACLVPLWETGMFQKLKSFLKRQVQDVPPELLQCEFGCRIKQCHHGKWVSCENRIRRMNEELADVMANDGGRPPKLTEPGCTP
jgi:hypothetical protein